MEYHLQEIHNVFFPHYDGKKFYKLIRSYIKYKYPEKNFRFHHMWMSGSAIFKDQTAYVFVKTCNINPVSQYYNHHDIYIGKLQEYDLLIQRKNKLKKLIRKSKHGK